VLVFNRLRARSRRLSQSEAPNAPMPDGAPNRDSESAAALRALTNTPTEVFLAHRHEINTDGLSAD
jgi:hypothetical protein